MQHTNSAELRLLLDTFSRVWGSGGHANLNLQTRNGKVWAKLDIQLGPPVNNRPGATGSGRRRGRGPRGVPQGPPSDIQTCHGRKKGPCARARDKRRREKWMERRKEQQQKDDLPLQQQFQETMDNHHTNDITTDQEVELKYELVEEKPEAGPEAWQEFSLSSPPVLEQTAAQPTTLCKELIVDLPQIVELSLPSEEELSKAIVTGTQDTMLQVSGGAPPSTRTPETGWWCYTCRQDTSRCDSQHTGKDATKTPKINISIHQDLHIS